MKSSPNWIPTSHRLSPIVGAVPIAMKPLWPSMLMSSTLVRDTSSVLRSRPIGLPRYQEKEKCGPTMPPRASHWQPTEFCAVLNNPDTRVRLATVSSLIPPHCGNNGPWLPCADADADASVGWDSLEPESEHPASIGITVTTAPVARASTV